MTSGVSGSSTLACSTWRTFEPGWGRPEHLRSYLTGFAYEKEHYRETEVCLGGHPAAIFRAPSDSQGNGAATRKPQLPSPEPGWTGKRAAERQDDARKRKLPPRMVHNPMPEGWRSPSPGFTGRL
jgi:hypothetical protein